MGESPYDFVMEHNEDHLVPLTSFVHRTFKGNDFVGFINWLKYVYLNQGGLDTKYQAEDSLQPTITKFKELFFEADLIPRTQKHISNPLKGSSAKRINMF